MQTTNIAISKLVENKGQIEGLPKNPRVIKNERFKKLVKSIEDAPEMLDMRSLIVFPYDKKYIVICGNMRLKACQEIGYKELPCFVLREDTPVEKLKEYTIKDNVPFGETNVDDIANEWDLQSLDDWGFELPEDWLHADGDGNEPTDKSSQLGDAFRIEVTCEDEQAQETLYNELTKAGYACRILTL